MGYIMILLSYLIIGFEAIIQRVTRKIKEGLLRVKKVNGITLWDDLYYTPGHVWLKREKGKTAKIGIDDLVAKLIGKADAVVFPEKGKSIKGGERAIKILLENEALSIPVPVSGKVLSVNRALERDPYRITRDPFGAGWIIKVSAENGEFKNFITGKNAEKWMTKEIESLNSMLSTEAGITAADGGEISSRGLRRIEKEKRVEIIRKFLKA
jgi:glycine cleavage system H protein